MTEPRIYRYKFTDDFINEIKKFIHIHRFDAIDVFKEAWEEWKVQNYHLVINEELQLKSKGYEGDVSTKMYKSVRYYYKNKPLSRQEPKKRKVYIRLDADVLSLMDRHITDNTQKPSVSYGYFVEINADSLKLLEVSLIDKGLSKEDINAKIKKTFKNRYFRLIKK